MSPVDELLACGELRAQLAKAEDVGVIPDEVYRKCGRHGLFGLAVPAKYGGTTRPLSERVRVHEAVARLSASLHSVLVVHEMVVHAIARFGRPEVQTRWLPALATGDAPAAFALTEPTGGSTFDALGTTATPAAGGFVLTGSKRWASSGLRARVVLVVAATPGGPVALLVDGDSTGLTRRPAEPLAAFRATSMADLRFHECVVAKGNQLSATGFGLHRVATGCLTLGRILVAAGACGIAAAALETAVDHVRTRKPAAKALADHEIVRAAIAKEHVDVRAGVALTSAAAAAFDADEPDVVREAMIAKLGATAAARGATSTALRLYGASGMTQAAPVRRYAAEAQVYDLIEGGTDVLLSALGGDLVRAEVSWGWR
ncbi:acyl-CoA dehydrogenase family protein [Kutzneria kofuensis]|uniref:Alkylation response protein AidB-like acyl-CoA dehydrogenase n=1 Tax=Kutzneria kofuensis TaxID=103725 RepID=A0A7W9KPN9_9PSEU|nr:acyl-CoA dehydrogenase family protein [Kutzneria kofuensis]MBB5896352.1 alkylation response protein AidB-like acyl-CoA dehydrogenase [Kutzneria kofuensis]